MTGQEQRLIRVEEKQKAMAIHIAELSSALQANTKVTLAIQQKLDELTGAKRIMVWITGIMLSIGIILSTLLDNHRK